MQNTRNDKSFFNKKYLCIGVLGICAVVFLFLMPKLFNRESPASVSTGIVSIQGRDFFVDIADTSELRTQGLSGRAFLLRGTGLLFIFDQEGSHGFWMKDMNFAIDIIWISADFRVVSVTRDVHPDSFPQVFYPEKPILYVLEVPSGDAEKIEIGDSVSFIKMSH